MGLLRLLTAALGTKGRSLWCTEVVANGEKRTRLAKGRWSVLGADDPNPRL